MSVGDVTHVVFDMDGVLLDTERLYTQATQAIVGRWGKTFDWSIKANMIGRPSRDSARYLVQALDLPITAEEYMSERNELLRQSFPAVPVSQITRFRYWGMHPNDDVFGVTYAYYDDGSMDNIVHSPWMAWTEFDLLAQLDPAKNLTEIYLWGYSGGGPGVDETVFDSVELCWFP